MNKSYLYLMLAAFLSLNSCNESGEGEVKNVTNQDSITSSDKADTISHTQAFQNLVKTNEGLIRGIKFSMTMDEVKKAEEGTQLEEETSSQLDYMMDYAPLEEAEINYLFDGSKKLSGIEIHVYPKDAASQDKIFEEFDKFFSDKIGEGTAADSMTKKWENKLEDLNVVLAKRGNAKIHDVNISITKIGAKPKA